MNETFSQIVTLDFGVLGEHEISVDYTYNAGRPGKMYLRNGDPGYPDEPAEAEILNVWLYGRDVLQYLTDKSYDSLLDTITSNHSYEE